MDCNLELGLQPSSTSISSTTSTLSMGSNHGESLRQEQMTIFYNGRICVCDVTELEARSIISLASEYTKAKEGIKCRSPRSNNMGGIKDPISATLQAEQVETTQNQNGVSMKRSLRQFLEKRRHRVQTTSPYHR